jgi:hypothetical protein
MSRKRNFAALIGVAFGFSLLVILPAIAAPVTVLSLSDLAGLKGAGGAGTDGVNVMGYALPNDGGGGHFVKNGNSCSVNDADDGVVVKDSSGNCWYRQFSGDVDIRWYGLSASTQDILTQFTKAFKAAENFGNRTVTTAGQVIALPAAGDLGIPTGDTLDCQGTIGGVSGDVWTVPTLPASIVIDPTFRIVAHSRSTLRNCNIRPNWFTNTTPMDTVRNIIDHVLHNFAGTAVKCTDDGCSIENVAVYGFDVGILADTTQRFYMNNVLVDSNVGIWWRNLPGASRNSNLLVDPVITQGQGLITDESWNVTGTNSSGECQLTLDITSHDNHIVAGDTVYVFGINQTFSIVTTGNLANGDPHVTSIDTSVLQDIIPGTNISGSGIQTGSKVISVDRVLGSVTMDHNAQATHVNQPVQFAFGNSGPVGCNGRWIVDAKTTSTVTLKGSSVTGASTTGSWSNGSNVITVTSLANIEPGQAVTGSGLSGTVVNVLPAVSAGSFRVILSAPASSSQTGASVGFSNSLGFTGDEPKVILSAATRVWTGTQSASGPNIFVTSGTGHGNMTIDGLSDTTRIQPGMNIAVDGTAIGTVTTVDEVNQSITVQQNVGSGTHSLTLSGCGYPGIGTSSPHPWLGNCAATAYLLGGPKADTDEDQGLGVVQAISKGWQVGFHLINALDTRCTGCQVNGNGSVFDRREFGIWFDDGTDETLWAGGGVHATGTALLQTSGESNNCDVYNGNDLETSLHDGWGFAQLDGCLQVIGTHNHNAMDAFIGAAAVNTVLQGNYFPSGDLFYENGTAIANTNAVGNTFRTGVTDHLVKLGFQTVPTETVTIGQPGSGSGMCLYNTADQTTNYERSCTRWTSNASVMTTEKGGTGVARDLTLNAASGKINLQNNGTTKFTVGSTINGISTTGAQIGSGAASGTAATLVPNRSALVSTGIGADTAGDVSVVVGANEDVRFDANHHTTFKGTAPGAIWGIIGTCSATVAGNDMVGRITLAASCASPSTTLTLNFNHSWANTPICFVQDETTSNFNPLYVSGISTTGAVFTAPATFPTSEQISYRCLGYR